MLLVKLRLLVLIWLLYLFMSIWGVSMWSTLWLICKLMCCCNWCWYICCIVKICMIKIFLLIIVWVLSSFCCICWVRKMVSWKMLYGLKNWLVLMLKLFVGWCGRWWWIECKLLLVGVCSVCSMVNSGCGWLWFWWWCWGKLVC